MIGHLKTYRHGLRAFIDHVQSVSYRRCDKHGQLDIVQTDIRFTRAWFAVNIHVQIAAAVYIAKQIIRCLIVKFKHCRFALHVFYCICPTGSRFIGLCIKTIAAIAPNLHACRFDVIFDPVQTLNIAGDSVFRKKTGLSLLDCAYYVQLGHEMRHLIAPQILRPYNRWPIVIIPIARGVIGVSQAHSQPFVGHVIGPW